MSGGYTFTYSPVESGKKSAEVSIANMETIDQFNDAIISLDLSKYSNYQVALYHTGTTLEWENSVNKNGGRFSLFFDSKIYAFRTFCVLIVDWFNKSFEFHNHIVGSLVSIKSQFANVQIWVDDGFDSKLLAQRYQYLVDWLKNFADIQNTDRYEIEFHVHPTYRTYNTSAQEVRSQANSIASFTTRVKQLSNGDEDGSECCPPVFNYDVAVAHKRSRKERRSKKSYVDLFTASGAY
ncbi:hypothetical protein TRFO_04740 [Tritrichomonas foetus]|uniref:Uncharacterized protein n=1 Tax=Tritrichomonas foetus TaxID=1144522 RepID=A0A1J4KCH9_9EUKA|nr:hypothetical protein TRFO_04740 [Tritrichomonas foetus]|eukprot:OHT08682.1 hypothetical protein TRFO_04740 [Tritrichomonas foetus]